ncbi:MAG: hypothetical protein WBF53_16885 [Litorimonas sp.]
MTDITELFGLLTSNGALGVLAVLCAALLLAVRYLFKALQASQDARLAEAKANADAINTLLREVLTSQGEVARALDRSNGRAA